MNNSQRGWRDPLKCSWDQALQSKIYPVMQTGKRCRVWHRGGSSRVRGGGSSSECHSRAGRVAGACCIGIWEHISCVIMLSAVGSRVSSSRVVGDRCTRHGAVQ